MRRVVLNERCPWRVSGSGGQEPGPRAWAWAWALCYMERAFDASEPPHCIAASASGVCDGSGAATVCNSASTLVQPPQQPAWPGPWPSRLSLPLSGSRPSQSRSLAPHPPLGVTGVVLSQSPGVCSTLPTAQCDSHHNNLGRPWPSSLSLSGQSCSLAPHQPLRVWGGCDGSGAATVTECAAPSPRSH